MTFALTPAFSPRRGSAITTNCFSPSRSASQAHQGAANGGLVSGIFFARPLLGGRAGVRVDHCLVTKQRIGPDGVSDTQADCSCFWVAPSGAPTGRFAGSGANSSMAFQ